MLEKVLDFQKALMFLTDTSEDIDAHFQYIALKKKSMFFRSGHLYVNHTSSLIVHLTSGRKTSSRLASPGPEWAVVLGIALRGLGLDGDEIWLTYIYIIYLMEK